MHSLQQLPLLAAAGVIDKVPGENLFQLTDGEVFYRLFVVQIRQRGPDPPLCRRTDLQSIASSVWNHLLFLRYKHSFVNVVSKTRVLHLYHIFSGLQVQERRCWRVLLLLPEKKPTHRSSFKFPYILLTAFHLL